MGRPDLIFTFTKVELWRQTQYKRIVYLDADMLSLRAPNELLTLDTKFAAVPDIGWPDCFNSGMMVLNPNMADYYGLLALAERGISFDGADQGLLNTYFKDWDRQSFLYNCTPSGSYQYEPAYRYHRSGISMVHFIGKDKPWTMGRDSKESKEAGGVYGELLGEWWATYDKHYRASVCPPLAQLWLAPTYSLQKVNYYEGDYQQQSKKLQDHVRGEELIWLPASARPQSSSQHIHQPTPQSISQRPPVINLEPPPHDVPSTTEQPLGDQPSPAAQVQKEDFVPTPTVEQRRFSAPHVEWEPTKYALRACLVDHTDHCRAPPPPQSKPEAANFPSTVYDFSGDTKLWEAPTRYPEAPKDMWYQVPEKAPEQEKPKPIFPWETRAPKPTRVFPQRPKAASPPPVPEPEPEVEAESLSTPSMTADATDRSDTSTSTSTMASPDPWSSLTSRTNAWDTMPEIDRYVQALEERRNPRKARTQGLHNTSSHASHGLDSLTSPRADGRRRPSFRLTDFPTKDERPSLPVTPAPIRRPSFWGDDRDETNLPTAEGVPRQEDWVRRFLAYPEPTFPEFATRLLNINGILQFKCQHCGEQNPIAKLEELQRRQSEFLGENKMEEVQDIPARSMPESSNKEAAIEAAVKSMKPKAPKPILKEPHFEMGTSDDNSAPSSTRARSATKGPSFNPITMVGVAASESNKGSPATSPTAA